MEKKKHYNDVTPSPDFAKLEENILSFWEKEGIFEKSVENRAGAEEFVFYDGPPFANGLPHYGHLLTGFVKDLFPRYQTMLGKKVERRFGWDCHGLPAEMGAEKDLGISGRAAIMNYGIDKFNAKCRTDVMKYAGEWEKYVTRQARWVDFENDYKTMDKSFMESVMWAFNELYNKGLLYEAMRVMPYSWAAETPLSNFETKLDNSYRERKDTAITVAFELTAESKNKLMTTVKANDEEIKNIFILAWTTTPWTLPSNLALAVKKDLTYSAVKKENNLFLFADFASSTVAKYFEVDPVDDVITYSLGEHLIGLTYKPLFPYFANQPNAFKIIAGEFIEEGSGTGVVHIAPGFGEEDFEAAKKAGIGFVVPVDSAGRFIKYGMCSPILTGDSGITDLDDLKLLNRNVLEANKDIIKWLESNNKLLGKPNYDFIHNYPHCWRTDEPLIYKAMPSWYVEVTKFKDRMVELNKSINWTPDHVRDGLFGKWLEGARDWSISRNRFWGAPIPIWRSKSGKLKCVGSIAELEKLSGKTVTDLHRPYIDEVTFTIDGEEYKRVDDVLDCWFESGSMPFASQGLTGEKPKAADFIVEYTAQTRGWFYTMAVLGTALFDEIPFKNVICHGVVLGEPVRDASTGKMVAQKLSKRLKNYPEPMDVFNQYGADALRWFMLSSPIMRGAELTIDKDGKFIRDIIRLYIKPIWNAYNFFTLYANADGIKAEFNVNSENLMDKYILSKCSESVEKIRSALNGFDTPAAYQAIEQFFEVLNNWYIRRSKERFWKSEADADKQTAYDTLYSVLHIMCRAAAPLLPLLTEEIYKNLTGEQSVHLAEFPAAFNTPTSYDYKDALWMDKVRAICNAALSIRSTKNIRVRQPLQNLTCVGGIKISEELERIIKDEINIKEIEYIDEINNFASLELKINFPILGKRLKEEGLADKMKEITSDSKQGKYEIVSEEEVKISGISIYNKPEHQGTMGHLLFQTGEFSLILKPKNPENSQAIDLVTLVSLDLNLTPELISEGLARDVVRMVQQARKDANLNITDRIDLSIETTANISNFADYIKEQTLAKTIKLGSAGGSHTFENDLDGEKIKIGLSIAS